MNSILPLFHSFYLHFSFFFTTFHHMDEEKVSVRLVCNDTKYAGSLRRSLQQRFPEWEPDPDRSNHQWYKALGLLDGKAVWYIYPMKP